MTPGNWGQDFPPEGVTHLGSGVYCLGAGINITNDIEGHNVVLKVEKGDVRFDGNAKIILDAPNSGKYAGLLLFVPMDNHSKVVLNGGAGSIIKGTILAPASPIHLNGMDSNTGFHSQIIGYTIESEATGKIKIVYNNAQNYNVMSMPEVQLAE